MARQLALSNGESRRWSELGALKAPGFGIAVGQSGNPIARVLAGGVLKRDQLADLVEAVRYGRPVATRFIAAGQGISV